jgi:hypothetical protein
MRRVVRTTIRPLIFDGVYEFKSQYVPFGPIRTRAGLLTPKAKKPKNMDNQTTNGTIKSARVMEYLRAG